MINAIHAENFGIDNGEVDLRLANGVCVRLSIRSSEIQVHFTEGIKPGSVKGLRTYLNGIYVDYTAEAVKGRLHMKKVYEERNNPHGQG